MVEFLTVLAHVRKVVLAASWELLVAEFRHDNKKIVLLTVGLPGLAIILAIALHTVHDEKETRLGIDRFWSAIPNFEGLVIGGELGLLYLCLSKGQQIAKEGEAYEVPKYMHLWHVSISKNSSNRKLSVGVIQIEIELQIA